MISSVYFPTDAYPQNCTHQVTISHTKIAQATDHLNERPEIVWWRMSDVFLFEDEKEAITFKLCWG